MDETIKTAFWSAPISAVLVTTLIWLLRNWITERLKNAVSFEYQKALETHKAELKRQGDAEVEKLKAQSNAELEKLKAQSNAELETRKAELKAQVDAALELQKAALQRVSHIDKSQFDMEFSSFQKLWASICSLIDKTVRVLNSYEYIEPDQKTKVKQGYAEAADQEYFSALTIAHELRPFIPKVIQETAVSLITACKPEIDYFFRAIEWEQRNEPSYNQEEAGTEARKARDRITTQWAMLGDSIRERLSTVIVAR